MLLMKILRIHREKMIWMHDFCLDHGIDFIKKLKEIRLFVND